MRYRILGKTGFKISEISLGTVELAQDYGLSKAPSRKDAVNLIKYALDNGINFIDTARAYDPAEDIIGEAIRDRKANRPIVATKLEYFFNDELGEKELFKFYKKSIETSLDRLGVDIIDILKLHQTDKNTLKIPGLLEVLRKLKKDQRIKFLGVSISDVSTARELINSDIFDVIQVAFNVFDQRLEKEIIYASLEKKIGVIVRSAFMRGIIPCPFEKVPSLLVSLIPYKERLNSISNSINVEPYEAALCFPLTLNEVSTTIVGMENISLLRKNIEAVNKFDIVLNNIYEFKNMAIDNEFLITPALWDAASTKAKG
ncbi:MAG: aldo/keto reductase [Patescibacteria group bacterium]